MQSFKCFCYIADIVYGETKRCVRKKFSFVVNSRVLGRRISPLRV